MRLVLDTNVLLSAFFTRGVCEALLESCLDTAHIQVVLSEHILNEFDHNANEKFGAPRSTRENAISFLRDHSEIVPPTDVPLDVCRDADDLPVIGTAIAGAADAIVTGDRDLIALAAYAGIKIVTPRQAYERIIASPGA